MIFRALGQRVVTQEGAVSSGRMDLVPREVEAEGAGGLGGSAAASALAGGYSDVGWEVGDVEGDGGGGSG